MHCLGGAEADLLRQRQGRDIGRVDDADAAGKAGAIEPAERRAERLCGITFATRPGRQHPAGFRNAFETRFGRAVEIGEAEQLIGATLAGVEAARALGVEVGAPLLRLTRVVFDAQSRAVERVVALYRADAYQYRMRLGRSGNATP